jgi:hypothetical protein
MTTNEERKNMFEKRNSQFQEIEQRIRLLERQNKILAGALVSVIGLCFAAALFWFGLANPRPAEAQIPISQTLDSLRVRQITIVDEKGTERIYIGSPVPDAMTADGKRVKRQKPSTGIVFNNVRGEEMSGWGVFDDESQNLCFDYKGAERLCLLQAGERAGLVIKDAQGNLLTMFGRVGFNEDAPKLILNDFNRRTRIKLHTNENGTAKIEMFDEKGKIVPLGAGKK